MSNVTAQSRSFFFAGGYFSQYLKCYTDVGQTDFELGRCSWE